MIIYNVTVKVDAAIAAAWLQWLLEEHIPAMMATHCFSDFKVVRLLDIDDSEGPTYAIQYFASDQQSYQRYLELFAETLRAQSYDKWGNRFIAFRTLMEVIR